MRRQCSWVALTLNERRQILIVPTIWCGNQKWQLWRLQSNMENIYNIKCDYIWTLNYVKHKRKEEQAVYQMTVCVEQQNQVFFLSLIFKFSMASIILQSMYRYTYSKKVHMKNYTTFAVFSEAAVVEGQLSSSPERASMGSLSSACF